jgi:hypothetical protein
VMCCGIQEERRHLWLVSSTRDPMGSKSFSLDKRKSLFLYTEGVASTRIKLTSSALEQL